MRALFLRFYRFTRIRGLIVLIGGTVIGLTLLFMGGLSALGGGGGAFGMAIAALAMIIVAGTRYRTSSATAGYEQILLPLLRSEEKYCLVLRPFGQDGEIILPKAMHKGRVGNGAFTRNVTMEQAVTRAADSVLGMKTYGIVDQQTMFAPPGPILMRAPDDQWQMVALRLIRRAHAIVLILPPDRDFGEGFAWEVKQIARLRAQSRVIIVLPPLDQDEQAHQAALHRACVLLASLDGSADPFKIREYEFQLPAATLVIKCRDEGGPQSWEPVEERKTVVADSTYHGALVEALREIEI